jgi:hypothetical protein
MKLDVLISCRLEWSASKQQKSAASTVHSIKIAANIASDFLPLAKATTS